MEDVSKTPTVSGAAPSEITVRQLDFSDSAEGRPSVNRIEVDRRGGDQAASERGRETAPAPSTLQPLNRESSHAGPGPVRPVTPAEPTAGSQRIALPDPARHGSDPDQERQETSKVEPASGPGNSGSAIAAPVVILRPDMTEEEMDKAAKQLRPPSTDEMAITLASRYRHTIRGMRKRGTKYGPILATLEQGPDGAEFKKHFNGDHRKLSRYIREKCPKN